MSSLAMPATIPHAAERAAREFGAAPALIDGGQVWSFRELWRDARATASAFLAAGAVKGDRIAIWGPNRREWILAALGAQAVGAAIVPLNTRLKGREAGDILRRARCAMLFAAGDFLGTDYPALIAGEDLPELRATWRFDSEWDGFVALGAGDADVAIDAALAALGPDDLSDIMFTSGTTGAPKGVMSTHGRVVPAFSDWSDVVDLREGDRYLIVNPFFHSFGYKAGWVAALVKGATIVPMPLFDVPGTIAHIERERISFLPGPPTLYQSLLAELPGRACDLSPLRVAVTGAATVPPVLVERMREELGFETVITAYGMTECGIISSCRQNDPVALIANSCGKAMPGLEVRIVDGANLEVARGQAGEIAVRGYGVMLGYLDDPQATAEAIDAEGWLHTGDIGTMDEAGYVRITDRLKDMYISGGFNCYPAEVEKLLCAHPAVAMVAVVGVPDDRLGEVGKAFVVRRPNQAVAADELLAWARANMANYKVPRVIAFVEDLPRNASGKVMKNELRL